MWRTHRLWQGADWWQAGQRKGTRCVWAGGRRWVGGNLEFHHLHLEQTGARQSGYGVHCKVRRLLEFIPNTCIFKPKSVHVRSAVLNGRDFALRRHL